MVLLTVWMVYVCWLYVQYGSSVGACWDMYNVALTLFIITSVWFFICSDVVSILLAFEMGNVPLVIMLVGGNVGRLVSNVGVKGVLQAVWMLLGYGVLSGACLVLGLWVKAVWGAELSLGLVRLDTLHTTGGMLSLVGWLLVMIAGAVKVAVVPFHVWLGKVHGESATVGSVLLAAIALKVGYVLHVKGLAGVGALISDSYLWWCLLAVLVAGTVWVCISLLWVIDVKRWIAVYSIGHMGVLYCLWLVGNVRSLDLMNGALVICANVSLPLSSVGVSGNNGVTTGVIDLTSVIGVHGVGDMVRMNGMIGVSGLIGVDGRIVMSRALGMSMVGILVGTVLGWVVSIDLLGSAIGNRSIMGVLHNMVGTSIRYSCLNINNSIDVNVRAVSNVSDGSVVIVISVMRVSGVLCVSAISVASLASIRVATIKSVSLGLLGGVTRNGTKGVISVANILSVLVIVSIGSILRVTNVIGVISVIRSVTSVNVVCCCELVNGLIKSVSLDVHVVVRSAIVISVLA